MAGSGGAGITEAANQTPQGLVGQSKNSGFYLKYMLKPVWSGDAGGFKEGKWDDLVYIFKRSLWLLCAKNTERWEGDKEKRREPMSGGGKASPRPGWNTAGPLSTGSTSVHFFFSLSYFYLFF